MGLGLGRVRCKISFGSRISVRETLQAEVTTAAAEGRLVRVK